MDSNVAIYQGEDFAVSLAVKDVKNAPYDLTGCSIDFEIFRRFGLQRVVSKHLTNFAQPEIGRGSFRLEDADTEIDVRAWRYRVILTDANGDQHFSRVTTWRVTAVQVMTERVTLELGPGQISVTLGLEVPSITTGQYGHAKYNIDKTFTYA